MGDPIFRLDLQRNQGRIRRVLPPLLISPPPFLERLIGPFPGIPNVSTPKTTTIETMHLRAFFEKTSHIFNLVAYMSVGDEAEGR
mmetsp:Transcript_27817/g.44247  ORF Transcript_27817/g.44247 Transcript_27817/m.44247 type:complete len:85 (+) Transcript_27817:1390-1644(+)